MIRDCFFGGVKPGSNVCVLQQLLERLTALDGAQAAKHRQIGQVGLVAAHEFSVVSLLDRLDPVVAVVIERLADIVFQIVSLF